MLQISKTVLKLYVYQKDKKVNKILKSTILLWFQI